MKISVGVITYNQQDTIRQTLDSILMQQGDFDLELVIGEDCSSDNTYAICQEYTVRYPNIVNLLPNQKNLGIVANYARVMQACSGEYIGIIAGDDYYDDDHALDKQMRYFLSHPEVGVMGCQGYRFYVRRGVKSPTLNPVVTPETDGAKEFYFSSKRYSGVYFQPVGLVIRRGLLKYLDFDEFVRRKFSVEDYPMQAVLSQYTHFACLPDLLVTYRIHSESATFTSYDSPKYLQYHRGLVEIRRYLNQLFPSDACVTEEQLLEQLFYKEFLYYVYHRDYQSAKQLVSQYKPVLSHLSRWKKANGMVIIHGVFYCFAIYKRFKFKKEIQERT